MSIQCCLSALFKREHLIVRFLVLIILFTSFNFYSEIIYDKEYKAGSFTTTSELDAAFCSQAVNEQFLKNSTWVEQGCSSSSRGPSEEGHPQKSGDRWCYCLGRAVKYTWHFNNVPIYISITGASDAVPDAGEVPKNSLETPKGIGIDGSIKALFGQKRIKK